MELRHLRYFVAVGEMENVTRAASKLHVSQPALSRQIRDLEEEIGLSLLERSAKAVRLTEAGRVFLTEARAVLLRAEEAVKAARASEDGKQVKLHVGYAPSLTVEILPQALRKFQGKFPRVRVLLHDLSTEEMLAQLCEGELQLALVVRPTRKMLRGLRFEELARYPICVAVALTHAFSRRRTVSLEKMAMERLIAYSRADYPEYHDQIGALFDSLGRKPNIAEEHDSVTSLIAAVEAGRGAALVPSCLACMTGPRLKIIPLAPAGPPIIVGVARRDGHVSAIAEEFIAAASVRY